MPGERHPAERLRLLAKIAEMYYVDGFSQQEIAERIRLSRPSISRLLVDARETGIVEIAVNHPIPTVPALEAALESHFPLRRAHVFERKTAADDETLRVVGRLGAIALSSALQDGMILGLAWGRGVHAAIAALQPQSLPRLRVVQIIGGVGAPYRDIDGPEQCRRAGEMFDAQHYYLNAPLLVDSPAVAAALREDHSIKEALELARQADVALVGIGTVVADNSTGHRSGYITTEDLRRLEDLGAVGSICTYHYDICGQPVPAEWITDCAVTVTWDDFTHIGLVIGVASGKAKAAAILGAIRSGILDVLVTDDAAAEEVLALMEDSA